MTATTEGADCPSSCAENEDERKWTTFWKSFHKVTDAPVLFWGVGINGAYRKSDKKEFGAGDGTGPVGGQP